MASVTRYDLYYYCSDFFLFFANESFRVNWLKILLVALIYELIEVLEGEGDLKITDKKFILKIVLDRLSHWNASLRWSCDNHLRADLP